MRISDWSSDVCSSDLAAVKAVGGDLPAAGLAFAEMMGLAGRGARHRLPVAGGEILLIDESYNANPASMVATIEQLGSESGGHKVAILGSVKELGSGGGAWHEIGREPCKERVCTQVSNAVVAV